MKSICFMLVLLGLVSGCSDDRTDLHSERIGQFLPTEEGLNVVIVSFDALRANGLGVYGYPKDTSPHIDQLAKNGLVFTQAHSAAQATPTSFAAAFSGNLPFRSFLDWKMVAKQTLADIFRQAGYQTALISDNVQLGVAKRNFNQGFDSFEVLESGSDEEMLPKTTDWLVQHQHSRFFTWFHFVSPHSPYDYREMATALYDPTYQGRFAKSVEPKYQVESKADITRARELYDGEVLYADHIFHVIWQQITELGLDKKTLIILTSDHGEEFMDHGGTEHDNLFEEVNRIPLIIWHPHALKTGQVAIPYSNVDLLSTLSSLLKLPTPTNTVTDGIDLFADNAKQRVKVAVAMTKSEKIELSGRQGDFKIVQSCTPEKKISLYNLHSDPDEHVNLAETNKTEATELLGELTRVAKGDPCSVAQNAVQGKGPEQGLSPEQVKKLRSLGYTK